MKLYFAPGAGSLSPHIISREAGIALGFEQVDNREKKTKSGNDYSDVVTRDRRVMTHAAHCRPGTRKAAMLQAS